MNRPERALNGMRHIAFQVPNLAACERFYVDLLGMQVLFRPHDDLVYLTLGNDNLSLSRQTGQPGQPDAGLLDHFGFIVDSRDELEQWYSYLKASGVTMLSEPHDHRDGARSFYCQDPAGNVLQPLYHPALSGQRFTKAD